MQCGKIAGEIEVTDMIIDGLVDRACLGNNLDILEHGELRGISRVSHMSIKRGGIFNRMRFYIDSEIFFNW